MEKRGRTLKLSWKITGAGVGIAVLVGILIGWFSLFQMERSLLDGSRSHAIDVAEMASAFVDGDALAALEPGQEGSEEYNAILDALNSFRVGDEVSFIYTMRKNGNQIEFVVDADPDDPAYIGEPYETYDELEAAFAGNVTADEEVTSDAWGDFYTGYAPIYDKNGEVAGVVGVDCSVEEIEARVSTVRNELIVMVIGCLLAAFVVAMVIGKLMARNVRIINRKMDELANSEGDLRQQIEVRSRDEIGNVADSFNAFMGKLRNMLLSVRDNEVRLEESTTTINQQVDSAAEELSDMTHTLSEMTVAMHETSDSVTAIAQETSDAREYAQEILSQTRQSETHAREISKSAEKAKENCQEAQQEMQRMVSGIAGAMQENIEATDHIAEIMNLSSDIVGISEQTQILALNASIEAARAGEQGRGFAVVAEQIGDLAEKTSETAKKIGDINKFTVDTVATLVKHAREMIDYIKDKVNADYEAMTNVGSNYAKDAQDFTEQMAYFCELSEKMSKNMDHIEENISQINAVVQEETAGISMVSETAEEVSVKIQEVNDQSIVNEEIIHELGGIIGRFAL